MKEEKLLKLLKALLANSKRSDRELAKAIQASQPTVTRNRKILGKYIRSYTIVPEFEKVGYEIVAFTFAKARTYNKNEIAGKVELAKKWAMKHPNIIFASDGEGLGKDAVMVSLHKNYSKYADFMREYSIDFADFLSDIQSFIVSLKTGILFKPFDLTYLANDVDGLVDEH
jgi:DNA-binding Lrp family transcriptional regulator